jgi:hypothetical protein
LSRKTHNSANFEDGIEVVENEFERMLLGLLGKKIRNEL